MRCFVACFVFGELFSSFFHRFFFSNTLKARGRKTENLQRKRLWLKFCFSRVYQRNARRAPWQSPSRFCAPDENSSLDRPSRPATTVTPSQHFVRSRATNDSPTVTPSDTRKTMMLPAVCGADKPHARAWCQRDCREKHDASGTTICRVERRGSGVSSVPCTRDLVIVIRTQAGARRVLSITPQSHQAVWRS